MNDKKNYFIVKNVFSFQIILIIFLTTVVCNSSGFYDLEGKIMRTKGDITLGGIFPMHEHQISTPEYPCGMVKEEKGIQRLEAMMYAIDLINRNHSILPNVSIGHLIIDSCSSDTYALEQSMEFVRYYMNKVG